MQTTKPEGMPKDFAEREGHLRRELFRDFNKELIDQKMDDRLEVLQERGEELVERAAMGAQEICGTISKCILLILKAPNRAAKRRLKAQLLRVIRKL